jgi:hypothetical protein
MRINKMMVLTISLLMGGCGGSTTTVEHIVTQAATVTSTTTTSVAIPRKSPTQTAAHPGEKIVPNLLGKRLDVAENTLHETGLTYKVIGGGLFGIVVRSDWTVCETEPASETMIQPGGRVKLIVSRSCE